jgi:hypothetical protein
MAEGQNPFELAASAQQPADVAPPAAAATPAEAIDPSVFSAPAVDAQDPASSTGTGAPAGEHLLLRGDESINGRMF